MKRACVFSAILCSAFFPVWMALAHAADSAPVLPACEPSPHRPFDKWGDV